MLRTEPCTQEMLYVSYFYLLHYVLGLLVGLCPHFDSEIWRSCIHQLVGCGGGSHSRMLLSHCSSSLRSVGKIMPICAGGGEVSSHSLCMACSHLCEGWVPVPTLRKLFHVSALGKAPLLMRLTGPVCWGGHEGTHSVK